MHADPRMFPQFLPGHKSRLLFETRLASPESMHDKSLASRAIQRGGQHIHGTGIETFRDLQRLWGDCAGALRTNWDTCGRRERRAQDGNRNDEIRRFLNLDIGGESRQQLQVVGPFRLGRKGETSAQGGWRRRCDFGPRSATALPTR